MKGKNLSKVLAFLLAAVMIFSALPLMAFASDETEPYVVSYGSPAILMNEMTKVNLADISVEMERGTVVSGANITWSAESQDGLSFDPATKIIEALAKGTYKLTATVGDVSKTIYVMAKTEEETDFYLLNKTLNKNTFVLEDWYLFDVNSGSAKTSVDDQNQAGYIKLGYGHMILPKDEIFKDFADYTVEAKVASNASSTSSTVKMGAGVAGRVYLDEDNAWKTSYKGVVSFIMQDYRVGVRRPDDGKVFRELGTAKADLTNANKAWINNQQYHDVKSVFSGSTVQFYYDNQLLFTSTEAANYPCTDPQDPGYPAVTGYGSNAYVKTFKVKLNSNKLAPTYVYVEPEVYTVSCDAPAIPMNENTGVDLKYVDVEITEGNVVSGADITWTAKKQENLYLNNEGKKVSVYAAGNYKLTATYEGVSKNVWVIAKEASETNFYLVNIPKLNQNTFVAEDWLLLDSKTGAVKSEVNLKNATYVKPGDGVTMLYKDEIFKDFADYTVESNMASNADPNYDSTAWGAGVAGRMQLDEAGAWNFNGIPFYVLQNYKVGVRLPQTSSVYRELGTAKTIETNEDKAWVGTGDFHTIKGVYNGSKVNIYYDGEELLDSTVATNYPWAEQTAPGYPAIVGYQRSAYAKSFKVYLNSNDMPEAIAAEVAPPEPEATINITGEGTAAVEAVVGSDNTYTVALAPADGYKVKTLSLIVNGDMRANLNHDNTGLVYTFTADDLANTVISVEYIPDDGTFNTVMAGASVWEERSAIRFGARTDLIKRSTTNTAVGTLDNRIKVGDTVYEITEVGMLLIPKGLLEGELTVDTKNVARQQVTKVVTLTDTFSDIAINLVGIPTSYYDVEISSRMYVAYEVDGETKYVYTDVIVRTYNEVLEAIGK